MAEQIVELAREEARVLNHSWVGEDHMLLALLRPDCPGAARDVLVSLGLTADVLREALIATIHRPLEPLDREPIFSAVLMLRQANCEAAELLDEVVRSEHVLLAMANSSTRQLRGVDVAILRQRVLAVTEGVVALTELPVAEWRLPRPST